MYDVKFKEDEDPKVFFILYFLWDSPSKKKLLKP